MSCLPTGRVVSNADCGAVGTGFESRRRHGSLLMYSAFAACGYSNEPSRRKFSRVVGGRGREVGGPWPPRGVLPQNWGGNEPNRTVICMVLKVTDNDRRHLTLCHDEFHGPRSGLC
ncbi:uncharacterized protein TNCV_2752701 [Trichonephila clavipes]|nr:uncharacterized protein TNCV_2752701 [Trichonephila clavipes]